jgi:hypothetical protein
MAQAIGVSGIKKIHAKIQRPGKRSERLLIIARAIKFAHAHAAQAYFGNG